MFLRESVFAKFMAAKFATKSASEAENAPTSVDKFMADINAAKQGSE